MSGIGFLDFENGISIRVGHAVADDADPHVCAYIRIWVSFPRTGEMAISCPFFLKSRALVWPNRKR